MRLYAPIEDMTLRRIYLLLTRAEAQELRDSLGQLLGAPEDSAVHHHIAGDDGVDLEVQLYDLGSVLHLSSRQRRILEDNE